MMVNRAEDVLSLFLPETYDVVWSAVILVIVAVFVYKFFMPKFNTIFDERARRIDGDMKQAKQAAAQAEKLKQEYEAELSAACLEAGQIRDEARSEASYIVSEAKTKAQDEANQITANAQRAIESERQQAIIALRQEVGVLATTLAAKIVGKQLADQQVQEAMIDQLIDGIDEDAQTLASGQ